MTRKYEEAMFLLASLVAQGSDVEDRRHYRLGAVGLRKDGVVVRSRNGSAMNRTPSVHAEARLSRKLTPGSVVFVARVLRIDSSYALAKPCPHCEKALRQAGVSRVYYTTSDGWDFLRL